MPASRRILFALAAVALLCAGAATALLLRPQPAAVQTAALERGEIGKIVHAYIVEHPEVLYEAQQEWSRRREAKTEEKRKGALQSYLAKIDQSKLHAVIGNPLGDVTLVEFFDYNCGYCRRAAGDIDKMIADDPKLRVVLMELPVIRQESLGASQVSIAVNRTQPDKFAAFHDAMLAGQSLATRARALTVAKQVGLDEAAIDAAAKTPEVEATLLEAKAIADDLGVEATPTYVIGDEVVPNTTSVVDDLQGRIAALRACGKAVC